MADIIERLKTASIQEWQEYDSGIVANAKWPVNSELGKEAAETITALRDRIAKLEKAMEPFAREGDKWAKMWEDEHTPALHPKGNVCGSCGIEPDCDVAGFMIGDLRAARAALDQDKGATGE